MTRQNRVDPFGDLHAVTARGGFTGNRGCLVDRHGNLVRRHQGNRWITCVTEFRDRKHPLAAPGRWTPLFFLDEAVALAAGHRPCAECRRDAYHSYRDAVTRSLGVGDALHAADLDRRLTAERLPHGFSLVRAGDRHRWISTFDDLPDGTVVVDAAGAARLIFGDDTFAFGHLGWREPRPRPRGTDTQILTPPTSVAALRHGFVAAVHLPS